VKKDGPNVELDVYSFMTTAPNALTDSINHERMPVLLSEKTEFETWLSGSPAKALTLPRSYDAGAMRIVQSGFEKKSRRGQLSVAGSEQSRPSADLIYPLPLLDATPRAPCRLIL
jgi:putative SOS response-associated peptidase YedK